MEDIVIKEDNNKKILNSKNYNFIFSKNTGAFIRWGKSLKDNPKYCPFGPEIADIEITTICDGVDGTPCKFCYKSNTSNGIYMTLEKYEYILKYLPKTITQIAFGVDAKCETNPDTFEIMELTREKGIIPNVTIANIKTKTARKLARLCGSVAVSRYADKEICYESVRKLALEGARNIYIHLLLAEDTFDYASETIDDFYSDKRLKSVNSLVFLSLKNKGRGKSLKRLSKSKFVKLLKILDNNYTPYGFDSCTAHKFIENSKRDKNIIDLLVEPCESSLFSIYINVGGEAFPCSFIEGEKGWEEGIEIDKDFSKVWNNKKMVDFRNKLLKNDRKCPYFKI